MEPSELIPRTKFDYERIDLLRQAESESIIPVLPQLLEWLQDMNWPIAQDIEDILVGYGSHLIPYLRDVLNSNDGCWKFSLIYGLINRLSQEHLSELKPDLERMRNRPSKDEIVEEFSEQIDELLVRIN